MSKLSIDEPFKKLDTIDFRKLAWNKELANNVTSLEKLKQYISLTEEEEHSMQEVLDNHPMNIPRYYLSLINPDDIHDPIRKLAIPTAEELVVAGQMGETTGDPYGDDKHNKGNGILHKYPYSALVVATEFCSMYCRHCFRKRLVGLPNDQTVENFQNAAKYIAEHKEITKLLQSDSGYVADWKNQGRDSVVLYPVDQLSQFCRSDQIGLAQDDDRLDPAFVGHNKIAIEPSYVEIVVA